MLYAIAMGQKITVNKQGRNKECLFGIPLLQKFNSPSSIIIGLRETDEFRDRRQTLKSGFHSTHATQRTQRTQRKNRRNATYATQLQSRSSEKNDVYMY